MTKVLPTPRARTHRAQRSSSRFLGGQWLRDVLQRGLFGTDAEEELRDAAECHHRGGDAKPDCDETAVAGADELPEQQRARDAAESGADGVEERDSQRPGLHGEDLAHGEVCGARARGGEEEGGHEDPEEGPLPAELGEEHPDQRHHQYRGAEIARGDHRAAADGVEQPAEQHRPEEVAGGVADDEHRHDAGGHAIEPTEQRAEVERDAVVDERLADEQRQSEDRPFGVDLEAVLAMVRNGMAAVAAR